MSLQLYAFTDFVTAAQNAMATGSPVKFTNFKKGSAAYALAQAIAGNASSLQLLIQNVFNVTRLGTSTADADVDSFVADYGLTRVPAVSATGTVTFTRNNTTVPIVIPAAPVGTAGAAVVQTAYSGIQFQVIPDSNNANYNALVGGYQMGNGVSSINVTVQALVAGAAGNVLANTISQLVSGTIGINGVSNSGAFTNGSDPETNTQLKARFLNFISSLSRATSNAIKAAVQGVQPNLTFQIIEGTDFNGTAFPAGFIVVADDGTGAISVPLQNQILAAINAVRAAGIQAKVYPPTVVIVNWGVHLSYGAGYNPTVVQNAVAAAVNTVINGYGVGGSVDIVAVQAAVQNTPGVAAYSGFTLNGGTATIVIAQTQLARAGTATFS